MQFSDNAMRFGWVSIVFHWLSVLLVFILIPLGLWMVELDYYDAWYIKGPDLHRSLGIILGFITLARLLWHMRNPVPGYPDAIPRWQQRLARWVHRIMYLLLLALIISGYLISTADGRSVAVFDWFEIPASLYGIDHQEDVAGDIHFWLAMVFIAVVALHTIAALKHQFADRANVITRILVAGRTLDD